MERLPATLADYGWMYDADPQVALGLRSNFQLRHKEARLRLAQLLAAGPAAGLARGGAVLQPVRREPC